MRLDESCEPVFARHETFHPRYGWVKKGFDASSDPNIFTKDAAVVRMGVGKNMVKSIRHWSLAFKILQALRVNGQRTPILQPTSIGAALFDDEVGADPYMELPGTSWLLHWWLLAPLSQAPVWWVTFNEFAGIEFTEEELVAFISDRLEGFGKPNASSLKKDVSVLLRMYSSGHATRATFEDKIDSPFRELSLIQPSTSNSGAYRFLVGPKATLPPLIFAAAVIDFTLRAGSEDRIVSMSRALVEPGSPGRAFRLTDSAAHELLEEAAVTSNAVQLRMSNGMPQLSMSEHPRDVMHRLLSDHYGQFGATFDVGSNAVSGVA
ncbi:DUF4007 family protein [Nocardioides cavernae]|uniref:DUF4007 family protein n=1 Tax=Nocardioides cavernae TaxID=1921566 RepID=A0ABR8NA11_9ACTN|nr:DUF4007 family protein [Nocardioides cavernae]MBD3923299.1 DUF4007 family protein [Nocardioides cavernae]MBM7511779.1 hypothetical protein [Nocardioides cavernae]